MSDDVLSVIPTDPHWQPEQAAAERAAGLVEDLAPGLPGGVEVEIDVAWHDSPSSTVVRICRRSVVPNAAR
ncbi:hypothetical protein [Streptomyces sediminimaris]|uniref:hypothetical protein n=1 Tax=Streptomyces sediminimaris TaxID=3383721 RepID=UPI00399BDAC2